MATERTQKIMNLTASERVADFSALVKRALLSSWLGLVFRVINFFGWFVSCKTPFENFLPYRLEPVMSQETREITLKFSPGPFGDNLEDNLVNSLMDLTIIPVCCSLFGGWLNWLRLYWQNAL